MLGVKFSSVLGWLVAVGVGVVGGNGVLANPLEEELVHLLGNHPQIKSQQNTVQSATKSVTKSASDYWPTVNVTGDIGPEVIDNPTTRSSRVGGKDFSRTRNVATLTVTQNVFDGFSTTSAVRAAQLGVEVARYTLEGTRQTTLFEGINNYIDVLRQKRLIQLSRNNESNIAHQLNLEDERVQRGSGVAVDVLQAKSRLQISKERRVTFEGALEDAVSKYMQVFDHAPDLEAMKDPSPPVDLLPTTVEEATNIAIKENPAVSNAASNIEVAREKERTAESGYYPTIDLVAKDNYEKHRNATLGTRRDQSVLLEASWDLFEGFSTQAGAAAAAYDLRASKDSYEYVARKVQEQVRLSWQRLLTARERLELLENAVNIATEVHSSRQKLREAGKETVINVLDAENEIFNAQINYTAASYDERAAVYQVLLAMGRLTAANLQIRD